MPSKPDRPREPAHEKATFEPEPGIARVRRRRAITGVDLSGLREQVDAACASAGVGPSTWLRGLALRELSVDKVSAGTRCPRERSESSTAYRAWLDRALTQQLDVLVVRGEFRSKAAALRALIIEAASHPGDRQPSSVWAGELVRALRASNHELVAVSGLLRRFIESGAGPGIGWTSQDLHVARTVDCVFRHLEHASAAVALLQPLLKRPSAP